MTRAWRASSGPSPTPPSTSPWRGAWTWSASPSPSWEGATWPRSPAPTPAATDASAPTWPSAPARACSQIQRSLLNLPRPLVHGDVKLQNVLLPGPDAPLSALTLIDLDSARELPLPLARLGELPPDAWQWLAQDVRDFGDLLAQLATGREGFPRDRPLGTGNPAFDTLVARCLRSFPEVSEGYTCLADEGLRFDLQRALDVQDAPPSGPWPGP